MEAILIYSEAGPNCHEVERVSRFPDNPIYRKYMSELFEEFLTTEEWEENLSRTETDINRCVICDQQ